MLPLLPFAAGLIAGGLAVRLLQSEGARARGGQAKAAVARAAGVGASALRQGSSQLRRLIKTDSEKPAASAEETVAPAKPGKAKRSARPATAKQAAATTVKAAAPRRRSAKAPAAAEGEGA